MSTGLFLCGRCQVDSDRGWVLGTTAFAGICVRCGGQAIWLLDARINEPRLAVRRASEVFSTACEVERHPTVIWDVNGWYAALGVSPRASRKELRDAFIAKGGQDDERLTYILTKLLDPGSRADYDACSLGQIFMDQYILAAIMKRAIREAAEAMADGSATEDDLEQLDLTEALDKAVSMLDNEGDRRQDGATPERTAWGYFLWRSNCSDEDRLSTWRTSLAEACAQLGIVTSIGVGYSTGSGPWSIQEVGDATVIFIDEDEVPTADQARAVAETIHRG